MRKYNFRTTVKLVIPIGALLVGAPILDSTATRGKIYPGVTVAALEIGGKNPTEAARTLELAATRFLEDYTTLIIGQVEVRVPNKAIYAFDLEKTTAEARSIGNTGTLLDKLAERIQVRMRGLDLAPQGTLNENALAQELEKSLAFLQAPAREARFLITFDKAHKEPVISVLPETSGKAPDFEKLQQDFGVAWLRLELHKPGAVAGASDISVTIERGKRIA